jgi:hypothetical protein
MTTIMIANARVWNAVVFPSLMKCIPIALHCLSVRTALVRTFNEHARLWFSVNAINHWLPNHPDALSRSNATAQA